MKTFSFSAGVKVRIDGTVFCIVSQEANVRRLVSPETQEVRRYTYDDLAQLYVHGQLEGDFPGDPDGARSHFLDDLSVADQERARFRLAFLVRVAELMMGARRGTTKVTLQRACALASAELNHPRTVSRAAYYRWKRELHITADVCALAGHFHNRGRKPLHPLAREVAREIWAEAQESARKAIAFHTTAWLVSEFDRRFALRNAERVEQGEVPVPTPHRSSTYAIFTEFPAYERDLLRNGVQKTTADYRSPTVLRASFGDLPLDLCEYDGTRIPIYLFDDVSLLPLGRPWFAALMDFCCDAPVGFYFGFEESSEVTFTSTLRHACLPKAYVADEYPTIANRYPLHGRARRYTLDNELVAHAGAKRLITEDLLSGIAVAPSRTPWWKPQVEGFFNQLNVMLLKELPGHVMPLQASPEEYDPTRNGCLGLRFFLYLFHVWLIDSYLQTPGRSGKTPAELWEAGAANWAPDLIARSDDLDLLFGIVREGRLDHRGVVYEGLWYHSDELQALRIRDGHTQQRRVKVNPSDLTAVHVFDERRNLWLRAEARDRDYAAGLSLHRHKLNLKNAAPGPITIQRLREAEARLRELIADAAKVTLSIQTAGLAARATGVGTQHIFNHLDVDGRLGALSGPFQGQSLNPQRGPSEPAGRIAPPTAPVARRVREIPTLKADRSLNRGRTS